MADADLPGTPATSAELAADSAAVTALAEELWRQHAGAQAATLSRHRSMDERAELLYAAVRPLIAAAALRRHAANMRAIEASMLARPDKTGADLIALTCVGAAAQYADRAVKARLVERAEHAEHALANADTVWRNLHAHTSAQYDRQSRSLALHQARADLMESRAIKAEKALVRFGRKLDGLDDPVEADRDALAAVIEQVRALCEEADKCMFIDGLDLAGDILALLPPATADVIQLTATEYREAVDHTLTALGYTRDELAAMADAGDFAGPVAFMAWQMCRDVPPATQPTQETS